MTKNYGLEGVGDVGGLKFGYCNNKHKAKQKQKQLAAFKEKNGVLKSFL